MDIVERTLAGMHPSWLSLLLYPLSICTLLFSMVVASRCGSGIAFGAAGPALAKAALLSGLVTLVNFFTCGIVLAGLVWFLGLIWLFDLRPREARLLMQINWFVTILFKVLVAIHMTL